jgi:hypothetical protein
LGGDEVELTIRKDPDHGCVTIPVTWEGTCPGCGIQIVFVDHAFPDRIRDKIRIEILAVPDLPPESLIK